MTALYYLQQHHHVDELCGILPVALHRGDSGLSAIPQMEASRATQAHQSQPDLSDHLPDDDPCHHPAADDSQPSGDWHRPADDPDLGASLPPAGPLEVKAEVVGENLHRLHQLADEAAGGAASAVLRLSDSQDLPTSALFII